MQEKFKELLHRCEEISDLNNIGAVLNWDQSTYMPPGGATGRARQIALLANLAHQRATDPALGHLLDDLQKYEESLPFDSDEASIIRVARRDFEQLNRIPSNFMGKFYEHSALAYQIWTEARPANDFSKARPYLERNLEYSRQLADFFPGYDHIADPLIGFFDLGFTAASTRRLFQELRLHLVTLSKRISQQANIKPKCLHTHFGKDNQLAFGKKVIEKLGYDFQRGRQDLTHHPFMTTFSLGDIRITTRVNENFLGDCLFSLIHEAGHAMYEQGIRMELEATPLASGTSSGVHESQSRLWENIVGRSYAFWEYFYPQLQRTFPKQLGTVDLAEFYRAINHVENSLIRTEADEVTYNLHVMMRFEFELQLLEGTLSVRDLPEAWHEQVELNFGITPPDDKDGVLQDVHWYAGFVGGAFQGYTIGNILSAQFFKKAIEANPGIPDQMRQGEFGELRNWLTNNIYQHGRKYTAPELIEKATGKSISIEPYIAYLNQKYETIYSLV